MTALLEVGDLVVEYTGARTVRVLNGVSFHVNAGETVAVVGESGCGKSTLAKAIVGLVDTRSGSIVFDGADITKTGRGRRGRVRPDVQMVFQDPAGSLNPRWRVGRSIGEPLRARGVARATTDERVAEVLGEVGLDPGAGDRYPHQFSGGQRQRINIGRALASRPKLLVADEPVSALDVSVQAQILNLLRSVQHEHELAIIFISHDLSVVEFIADRIIVLYLGEVMEEARTGALFDNPRHPYTRSLMSAAPSVDPDERRERVTPIGEPPSVLARPPGCPFTSRCPFAVDACHTERPALRLLPDGSRVACHRVGADGSADFDTAAATIGHERENI